jgi:hypothetical protein
MKPTLRGSLPRNAMTQSEVSRRTSLGRTCTIRAGTLSIGAFERGRPGLAGQLLIWQEDCIYGYSIGNVIRSEAMLLRRHWIARDLRSRTWQLPCQIIPREASAALRLRSNALASRDRLPHGCVVDPWNCLAPPVTHNRRETLFGPAPAGVNLPLRPQAPERHADVRNPNDSAHSLRLRIKVGVAQKAADESSHLILSHAQHNQALASMPEGRLIEIGIAREETWGYAADARERRSRRP